MKSGRYYEITVLKERTMEDNDKPLSQRHAFYYVHAESFHDAWLQLLKQYRQKNPGTGTEMKGTGGMGSLGP